VISSGGRIIPIEVKAGTKGQEKKKIKNLLNIREF